MAIKRKNIKSQRTSSVSVEDNTTYLLVDPSLRFYGWSVIHKNKVLDCGCIAVKKTKLPAYSDEIGPADAIATTLIDVIAKYKPTIMLREEFIGSKSSKALRACILVKGVTLALAKVYNMEQIPIQPLWSKQAATGDKLADKHQMVARVLTEWPELKAKFDTLNLSHQEGIADSLALWFYFTNNLK